LLLSADSKHIFSECGIKWQSSMLLNIIDFYW
jgi:hypothetical protein